MKSGSEYELVTALADEEIADTSERNKLSMLIEEDEDLKVEYKIQVLVKSIVREKLHFKQTPSSLKNKILKMTGRPNNPRVLFKHEFLSGDRKPAVAFATALVILVAAVLIIFNRLPVRSVYNYAALQTGPANMFIEAKDNFKNIINGKLVLQISTGRPAEVVEFFKKRGVNYNTFVPVLSSCRLLGAVVSEEKGRKLAHEVFTAGGKKMLYIFMVNERLIKAGDCVHLTQGLLKFLDDGEYYAAKSGDTTAVIFKRHSDICVALFNFNSAELVNELCQTK